MARGTIALHGMVHGALNTVIVYDNNDLSDWEFKQFVSQAQLEAFAKENDLAIIMEKQDDSAHGNRPV